MFNSHTTTCSTIDCIIIVLIIRTHSIPFHLYYNFCIIYLFSSLTSAFVIVLFDVSYVHVGTVPSENGLTEQLLALVSKQEELLISILSMEDEAEDEAATKKIILLLIQGLTQFTLQIPCNDACSKVRKCCTMGLHMCQVHPVR